MIIKQTSLDLNGPILSFAQQPTSVSICNAGIATFVGIATATFPQQSPENPVTSTGTIAYRWYDDNGPLFDDPPIDGEVGSTIVGAATTVLTLYNNLTNREVFLKADYIPSAYGQDPITVGTARSTPNAINDTLDSSTVTLSVYPLISIKSILYDSTVVIDNTATFTTQASASDGSDVSYQWQLNGIDLADGKNTNSSFIPSPLVKTLTITDDLGGGSTTIDFNKLSTYSNFITGRTYTITANANIETKIYAVGGGGGNSSNLQKIRNGGSGGAAQGAFIFEKGKTYKLIIGGGPKGALGGYGGGGNAEDYLVTGQSCTGAGGGYTGLFLNSVSRENAILIAGGGGGGSSYSTAVYYGGAGGGLVGGDGNRQSAGGGGGTQSSGGFSIQGGIGAGSVLQGGRGGGGGGGGGYFGGGSGRSYTNCNDGPGGGGSGYINPTLLPNGSFDATNSAGGGHPETDGSFKIDLNPIFATTTSTVITVSGTKTPTLKISSNITGFSQIRCKVTHPTACNSPLFTNTSNFIVVLAGEILNYESVSDNGSFRGSGSLNLSNNPITFNGDPSTQYPSVVIYPPEKDIRVRITLAGAAGATVRRRGIGGEGGLSVFEYTLKQNTEYTLKLGSVGGSIIGGANGGGGAAYLYEKARLIAVCGGGGGGAGQGLLNTGGGGAGGGIGVGGENGKGRDGGVGGRVVTTGSLPTGSGTLPSGLRGGQVSGCTIGKYYAQAGFSPCQDVGNTQWRNADGNVTSQTATIQRGYKAGQGLRNTGGSVRGVSYGGGGGSGAYGGNAADSDTSGGGGGSGYTDGSVTVISTQLGGNSSTNAFVTIGLAQTYNDFFIDSFGRILILSSSTVGKDPRTLTKTTGKVLVNTDTCIDDARWQNFIELARTQNYRLTATLNNSTTKITNATDNNIRRMINGNNITLKNSLTAWEDTNYNYQLLALAWDETNASGGRGFGSDYSILSWSPSSAYGFGYYGESSNPFFVGTTYSRFTANWWILPPGVPDF